MRVRRLAGPLPRPGWSWTITHNWTIDTSFATATLLLGAGLAGIPVAVAGSWEDAQVRDQTWAFLALGVAGLLVLAAALVMRHGRMRMLRDNGTAYIVQESSEGWASDGARDFLAGARQRFARTIVVPGPDQLSGPWDWPLDDRARQWDQKVTELVRSFKTLHLDDDPATPNGLFVWAPWPVSLGLAARACAADRELVLDVWQRPSAGRAGPPAPVSWEQRAHRFAAEGGPAGGTGFTAQPYRWPVEVTMARRVRRRTKPDRSPEISVLLLRLGAQPWGPLDAVSCPSSTKPITLPLEDAAGLGLPDSVSTYLYELRVLPPAGQGHFSWSVFPQLVRESTEWLQSTVADLDDHMLLLGAVMPPEVALGLGIAAARTGWPATLWPIVYEVRARALVVPRLNLGDTALTPLGKV